MPDITDRVREERNRLTIPGYLGLSKTYIEGRVSLECAFLVDGGSSKRNFVFRAIERGVENFEGIRRMGSMAQDHVCATKSDRDKLSMRGVSKLVQGPEGVIP